MQRMLPTLLWCAATLMVAGCVHLASILILPFVAPDDVFSRLVRTSRPNTVSILPRPAPREEILPFRDPALAAAICRYDLSEGGLRVGAELGDAAFMAISFHGPTGVPFYALTSRSGTDGRIELLLLTPAQREKAEAADGEDEPEREVRVTAPEPRGFVEFDLLPRVGGPSAAREPLRAATCRIEPAR